MRNHAKYLGEHNPLSTVYAKDLEPGKWYWWVYQDDKGMFHKFCVVRCFQYRKGVVAVNISENLLEDDSYYIDQVRGVFYGPIYPPVGKD